MKQKLLDTLEARLGRFAVTNLALYLVVFQLVVFILAAFQITAPGVHIFSFVPALAFGEGELWRLFTFVLVPIIMPSAGAGVGLWDAIIAAFSFYILFMMGSSLEERWGTFRFNLYVLSYILITMVMGALVWMVGASPSSVDTLYLYVAIFIAFATLFPDIEFLIMFILPIKVKWIAIALFSMMAVGVIGAGDLWQLLAFGAVVATYGLFFGQYWRLRIQSGKRRAKYERQTKVSKDEPFHRCYACGRTDKTDPDKEFRYVKEEGESRCYCANFLKTGEKCPPIKRP